MHPLRRRPSRLAVLVTAIAWLVVGCSSPDAPRASPRGPVDGPVPTAGLPSGPPPGTCEGAVTGTLDIAHPTLGPTRIFLTVADATGRSTACVVPVTARGAALEQIRMPVHAGRFRFASPATDGTGNTFVRYHSGPYDGVLVLVPGADGFVDPGLTSAHAYRGRLAYHHADLLGPDTEGRYAIEQSSNDCVPDCASGTVTKRTLSWNGSEYVG